jgi:secreted PhoX family phosphatase
VVDLKNGKTKVLVQRPDWEALDGIVWTPWNTILVGEETGAALLPAPEAPNAQHGLVYEISLRNHTKIKSAVARPMIGSMAHEGIEVDGDGNVYVIDEFSTGSIYKFVPDSYGDLSSGDLYVLTLDVAAPDKTGPAHWVKLDRNDVQVSARNAAAAAGATPYGRPEDMERIGNTLYVAITSENRVLAVTLGGKPMVSAFVDGGLPSYVADKDFETADTTFEKVDNLASGPDGRLWIVEDNNPSDIWVADPDSDLDGASDKVRLFASFNDKVGGHAAEGTGIYFGNDPHTLFVNVQHASNGNDRTVAISRDMVDEDEHGEHHGHH